MEEQKNERLWEIAKKRAKFKMSLYTYIVVNIFLWAIYFFTNRDNGGYSGLPWPAWASLGWGIGLAFQYFDAYYKSGNSLEQQEYDKLKEKEINK